MFQTKRIATNLLLLTLIIFLAATPAMAKSSKEGNTRVVSVVETGMANTKLVSTASGTNGIESYSRYWFIPACSYGQVAFITFDVDTGPFTIDFYSSKYTYSGGGYCDAETCGYEAWAPVFNQIEQGEYMYFATVNGNAPIITSGWCSIPASPSR